MSHSPRLHLVIAMAAVVILVSASLALGLHKTVLISQDGQSRQVSTYAFTVGNLLHELHIALSPQDELSPSQDSWLKNGSQVVLVHAIPVQILADGSLSSFFSADRNPSRLLALSGIVLQPGDILLTNGNQLDPNQPLPGNQKSISLQVVRSASFSLSLDGQSQVFSSATPTLGSALWSEGYTLYAADQVKPPVDTPLMDGMVANLVHSRPVTVTMHGARLNLRTPASTVGEALEDAGLSIQGLDYSLPSPDEPVPADGEIRLVRVTEDVLVEQSPISFETEYRPDPNSEIDSQSILQAGEYGLSAQRIRVRYEDGQEISRQLENQWVARQPVPRILGYGTQVVMHSTVVDGVEIQYWRMLNMYATSYHPSEVGDTTASGERLRKGIVAVDTSIVPFYTQMYVPGYGEALAADIGGGVIGRMIDLGYSDNDYVPWHEWVTVYFLWPPPANIVWVIP